MNLLKRFSKLVRLRPWFFLAAGVSILVSAALPNSLVDQPATRWLIAWNCGAALYLIMSAAMMMRADAGHIRQRAVSQDVGQGILLVLTAMATLSSLGAIAFEMLVAKELHGMVKTAHMALAGITVVSSWAFIQVMFAIHYAHMYYARRESGEQGGLDFLGTDEPDYAEFFYFSAIIGTSGQTADVPFSCREIRRVGTVHCILTYLFNTTVLALLINIGASLL
jgi:uncharacterized membrane protein